MKKFIILAFLISAVSLQAQEYKQAIGLRGGLYNGITYKNFVGNHTAIEGILHTRWQGWEVVGLREHYNDIRNADGLYWFYGYGAHLGFYDDKNTGWSYSGMVLGVDGIIGLEYQIKNAPITLGIDWKPYVNLIGYSQFFGDGGALSIQFTF